MRSSLAIGLVAERRALLFHRVVGRAPDLGGGIAMAAVGLDAASARRARRVVASRRSLLRCFRMLVGRRPSELNIKPALLVRRGRALLRRILDGAGGWMRRGP